MAETATSTGVAPAMKYFGKLPGQSLADFKDEWLTLSPDSRKQLVEGITNGSLNY